MDKKNLIKLTLTIAATLAFVLYLAIPDYKYEINHSLNDKHHPIIQIRRDNGYTCSAFVVNDKIAVTAGHCVGMTKQWMETGYKERMKASEEVQRQAILYLSRIEKECIGPHCESLYYQTEQRYKAEVAAYNEGKKWKKLLKVNVTVVHLLEQFLSHQSCTISLRYCTWQKHQVITKQNKVDL